MNKALLTILLLFGLSASTLMLALMFGPAHISNRQLMSCLFEQCASPLHELVLWQLRLPRVLVGFVAGMGLACTGALLQNTTRNPLADPYLFGIVAGAGLGATVASLSLGAISSFALPLSAFLGALFAVALVFILASTMRRMEQLLLAGVAVSFMLGAFSQFLLYLGEPMATNRVLFWLMGSLSRVSLDNFYMITLVVIVAYVLIFAIHRQIDALALGDSNAEHLGVNIQRLKLLVLMICAAVTAVIVAYCGGIAFIGLMMPHMVRFLFGNRTLPLTLISGIIGGCFLVWVDVIARSAVANLEIPIGIITSAIGSLFFLLIMYHSNKQQLTG